MEPETKNCQNCKTDFTIEPEDFVYYQKIKVPPPTFCYLCRAQRRFAFRNERALSKRKSDLSGEEIFSSFRDDVPFPVYTREEWHSDDWDPMIYGKDYDFDRSFFEQFRELYDSVPRKATIDIRNTNSPFSNNAGDLKNCYLVFNSNSSEDCSYGTGNNDSKFCFDNTYITAVELSYENIFLGHCYRSFYSFRCEDSTDIYFSKNLKGCNNCFGCVNLKGKSYYIFNKPYSKEDYQAKIKEFNLGSYSAVEELKKKAEDFWAQFADKFYSGNQNVDVIGEYVYNSKNAKYCYLVASGAEDCKYCQYLTVASSKDCYDYSIPGYNTELAYDSMVVGVGGYNIKFSLYCYPNVKNLEYCEYCNSSSNLFGCVSLRNKEYCILNKQYSKEEYEKLVSKIKQQMMGKPYIDKSGRIYKYGEFLPAEFSPFGYNETIAQEHFPLTKDEINKNGYLWKEVEVKDYAITLPAKNLSDNIKEVDESILKETIGCLHEKKCDDGCIGVYRLTPKEFEFYQKLNIPIPRLCPTCRHRRRLKRRNSLKLYDGKCMCAGKEDDNGIYTNLANAHSPHKEDEHCPNEFQTAYKPGGKEILYCEPCYQEEVV